MAAPATAPVVTDEKWEKMGEAEREIYLQMELMADEPEDTPEIKRKKRMGRNALTLWEGQIKELRDLRVRLEVRISQLMNEVYQLVSLYSVFAGVVLTAVSTSSRLECQHLWSPVGLCLFTYSMIIVIVHMKFRNIHDLERSIEFAISQLKVAIISISVFKDKGFWALDFERDIEPIQKAMETREIRRETRARNLKRRWRRSLILIPLLTVFTAGLMGSFIHILCFS